MQSNHVSPADAVRAARDLEAQVAIPMHFGTWQLGDDGDAEPLAALVAALAADSSQRDVWRVARHGHAEVVVRARSAG
jgi:L-ascorbate metabolism protein UlaG (beta-lactamase superfamily)